LIDEMLALPPPLRRAHLAGLPASQQSLRPLLEELVDEDPAAADDADALMARLPGWVERAVDATSAGARSGAHSGAVPGRDDVQGEDDTAASAQREVGPYRLLRRLGRGGMGTVWLARRVDGSLQRAVALKLPHQQGVPDSFARRFERERDILATLEHPLIARLSDAGTAADGQPWLALEYVEGAPITVHCDQAGLSLGERVRLFVQVLKAVQFAHARLVVHRDLKPSNIFVSTDGQVRLLDFGVAALLQASDTPAGRTPVQGAAPAPTPAQAPEDDDGLPSVAPGDLTEFGPLPMTPNYASPEQIGRRSIGTASDVYSLGVVFFELLVGQRPYRLADNDRGALEAAILTTTPQRPSRLADDAAVASARATVSAKLRRQLRGDLDVIALKALKKDPAERYASAEAFATDLERWQAGLPVRAHVDSSAYRLRKFVLRHRWPVGLAALAGVALVAGTLVALDQAQRATREARRTQAVQAFLIRLFREAEPARAQGRELSVRDLLQRGEQHLTDQLGAEPDLQAAITGTLVDLYDQLGDGHRGLPLAESQVALALKASGAGSAAHGDALLALGRVQASLGRHEQAMATLEEAARVLARHADERGDALLVAERGAASALNNLGRPAEAVSRLQALLPRLVARFGANSWEDVSARAMLATAYSSMGEPATAARLLKALQPQLTQGWPAQGFGAAELLANVGYVQWQARAWADAQLSLEAAITDLDRLLGPRNSVSIEASRTLGMVHLDAGEYAKAAEVLARNLARSREFHGEQDGETALNGSFAVLGWTRAQRLVQAEAAARESVRLGELAKGLSASERRGLRRRLATAVLLNGHPAEALALADRLLADEVGGGQGNDIRHAATLMVRAGALNATARPLEAAEVSRQASALWGRQGTPAGRIGQAKSRLTEAMALMQAGRLDAVPGLLDQAERQLAQDQPAGHPDHAWARYVRSRWLAAQGRTAAAEALAARSRAEYQAASGVPLPTHWPLVL
jgi:eukaryotic-like serine/threonine-protein kinase